jgi:hypothetical protein
MTLSIASHRMTTANGATHAGVDVRIFTMELVEAREA